jgi:hypothetical protein
MYYFEDQSQPSSDRAVTPPSTAGIAALETLSVIPEMPGCIMPNPWEQERAFEQAFREIELSRGRRVRTDEYASKARRSAYRASCAALWNSCTTLVIQAHPHGSWSQGKKAPLVPEVQVVSSSPGSGKSTAAKAFMVAVTRTSEANGFPLGCLLLVHHVHTANVAYNELEALLPGCVAVFTAENDKARSNAREPAFSVDELEQYPVLVTTHEFYKQVRGDRARIFTRGGLTLPRVVTFIDEKVEEIQTFDATKKVVEHVCEFIQRHEEWNEPLLYQLRQFHEFVMQKRYGTNDWETPAHDPQAWSAAERVQWFTTQEAGRYMRAQGARGSDESFKNVFGLARSLAERRMFVQRRNGGEHGTNYVGYERAVPQVTGMVLLDATADIDGTGTLCPWRKLAQVLPERYDRLEVIHVHSIATGTLTRWLDDSDRRELYIQHMLNIVQQQVAPGQNALIVCKRKLVVETKGVPNWSEHMTQFVKSTTERMKPAAEGEETPPFPWDHEGRKLAVAWYGGYGIGANDWRDADVVLLFDEYHLPQRIVIATVQGLKDHEASEGILHPGARPTAHPDVEALKTGHALRWLKQMALRGKAREFDAHGICGQQKLVVTGDIVRLVENFDALFPGATLRHEPTALDDDAEHLAKLIYVLMRPELEDTMRATKIGELIGVEWRKASSDLINHHSWHGVHRCLGWEYVSRRGKLGSFFRRVHSG